jgi:hypothetical protein
METKLFENVLAGPTPVRKHVDKSESCCAVLQEKMGNEAHTTGFRYTVCLGLVV